MGREWSFCGGQVLADRGNMAQLPLNYLDCPLLGALTNHCSGNLACYM